MVSEFQDISKKTFWIILALLIAIRILMVFLSMQGIPYTGVQEGGWWFFHGGDEQKYFNLAKSIVNLKLIPSPYPLGYSLFLAPFAYFTNANTIKDILKPVFITQALILFSLSIILVGLMAKHLFRRRKIAAICAGIFTFYPYIFYLLFHKIGPYHSVEGITRGEASFQFLNWLQIISESLSAFLVYLCFFLFFIEFSKKNPKRYFLILLGILSGFSVLVRLTNIFIVGIFVLGWIFKKRIKEASLIAVFSFFSFLPQLIYNKILFGSPFVFGYQALLKGDTPTFKNFFSMSSINLSRWILLFKKAYFYAPIIIYFLPLLAIILVLGIKYFKEKENTTALVLGLWFFSYSLFYALFSLGGIQARYFIPAVPPLIFIIIGSFLWIFQKFKILDKLNLFKKQNF